MPSGTFFEKGLVARKTIIIFFYDGITRNKICNIRGEFNVRRTRGLTHRLEDGFNIFFNIIPLYFSAFGSLFF